MIRQIYLCQGMKEANEYLKKIQAENLIALESSGEWWTEKAWYRIIYNTKE